MRETWMDAAEWRAMPWWPEGIADIRAGWTGHDHEIVVNIRAYGQYDEIPDAVFQVFAAQLPESWKLENRSTRIEVHPSGRLFGGYTPMDITVVELALQEIGLEVGLVDDAKVVEDDIG